MMIFTHAVIKPHPINKHNEQNSYLMCMAFANDVVMYNIRNVFSHRHVVNVTLHAHTGVQIGKILD